MSIQMAQEELDELLESVRKEALEEAAKVCAMMEWQGRSEEAIWKGDAADECAAAIRSLCSKDEQRGLK